MVVFAVIIAVIAALVLIPIRICISYHGSLSLWIRVLFLRFDIFPRRQKSRPAPEEKPPEVRAEKKQAPAPPKEKKPTKKAEKPPEAKKTDQKPAEEKPKAAEKSGTSDKQKTEKPQEETAPKAPEEKAEGLIDQFLKYYRIAQQFFDPFRRALRRLIKAEKLELDVRFGTEDAADTAVYTGVLWGVAYNLLGLIARFVTVEKHRISIEPVFNDPSFSAAGDCIIRTNIANIIGAAAIAATAYLRYVIKNRRNKQ